MLGFITLDRPRTMQIDANEIIEKNIRVVWNIRGMTIEKVLDPLIAFVVKEIAHNFFQSSRLDSVSCMAIDLCYKIIKKNHTYELAELQL